MKNFLMLAAVAFALLAGTIGTVAVMTAYPQPAYACTANDC